MGIEGYFFHKIKPESSMKNEAEEMFTLIQSQTEPAFRQLFIEENPEFWLMLQKALLASLHQEKFISEEGYRQCLYCLQKDEVSFD